MQMRGEPGDHRDAEPVESSASCSSSEPWMPGSTRINPSSPRTTGCCSTPTRSAGPRSRRPPRSASVHAVRSLRPGAITLRRKPEPSTCGHECGRLVTNRSAAVLYRYGPRRAQWATAGRVRGRRSPPRPPPRRAPAGRPEGRRGRNGSARPGRRPRRPGGRLPGGVPAGGRRGGARAGLAGPGRGRRPGGVPLLRPVHGAGR